MSRRIDRVNELLKREISSILQRDFEWDGSLVTVNAVEVSRDLKEAKVFRKDLKQAEAGQIDRVTIEPIPIWLPAPPRITSCAPPVWFALP